MTKLNRLIKEARESCQWRGHRMDRFQHNQAQTYAISVCRDCGYGVGIKTNPLPNEIYIVGSAVALNCKEGK